MWLPWQRSPNARDFLKRVYHAHENDQVGDSAAAVS
jgi:hypothetical protein